MPQVINTNTSALFSQRSLNSSQRDLSIAMERLSSGKRINSAADDAAGSAIADRMTSQVRGLNQAVRNANDTISLTKTAEGAMMEASNVMQRMRELSIQSASDTNTSADRQYLQKEIELLKQELNNVSSNTEFNSQKLLDGSFTAKTFQIGSNANQNITFNIASTHSTEIGSHDIDLTGTLRTAIGAAANAAAVSNTVTAAEDLTLSGRLGTTTIDVLANNTARDVAGLVNGVINDTGVAATAITKARLDGISGTGTYTMNLYGKNTTTGVNISANITNTSDLSNLASAINSKTGTTGITAELSADKATVTLTQPEGYDVILEDVLETGGSLATINMTGLDQDGNTSGAAQALGAAAITDTSLVGGSVQFSSASDYTVTSGAGGGLFANPLSNASTLSDVSSINITTQTGANAAISVLDGALTHVQNERANLGSISNRLTSTISNLENISQNTEASRSSVMDADFAKESAELAKNQIMQQAGTAMLAQANQLSQNVMSLLQ